MSRQVAVLDREYLVRLAREGHLPSLPSLATWKAMASEDRVTLIRAVIAYAEARIHRHTPPRT